ncbi:MAG: hypothetical protein MJY62_05085 [Bacteroidales bacterium]|nr:hypothetical protein [Bacteroidales bacterium]
MSAQNKEKWPNRIRINVSDDIDHNTLWDRSFTRTRLIAGCITAVVLFILVIFSLIAYTPIRTAIPGYPDAYTKRAAVHNAYVIDSLQTVIDRWELYTENLRRVIDGKEPVYFENVLKMAENPEEIAKAKAEFRRADSLLRTKVRTGETMSIDISNSFIE